MTWTAQALSLRISINNNDLSGRNPTWTAQALSLRISITMNHKAGQARPIQKMKKKQYIL